MFSACMSKQFNVIVDNKLSKDAFLGQVALKIGSDEDKKEKAGKVADACLEKTDEDRCEAAYNIWKCVATEAEALKLDLL